MKKFIYCLISFLILLTIMSNFIYAPQLFHNNGVATQALKDVFNCLDVSIATLEEANTFAQKNFLRVGERWDKQLETDIQKKIRNKEEILMDHFKKFGMIEKVNPPKKQYEYALLLGSLKKQATKRMNYLSELFELKYDFKYVVLLGGQRPLLDHEKEELPENIHTELEMMIHLFKNHPILKDKKLLSVDAPMIKKADGSLARPITDDTLEYFAKIAPEYGYCLVISNNPYVVRQTKVAQRILNPKGFFVEGTGKEFEKGNTDILILMDEFARLLYEEYKVFNLKNNFKN